jgi:hypothetical protein
VASILRLEPEERFLLFRDGPEPPMAENWLLDVQLATAVFKADQAAIWLAELGLPASIRAISALEAFGGSTQSHLVGSQSATSSRDWLALMQIKVDLGSASQHHGVEEQEAVS